MLLQIPPPQLPIYNLIPNEKYDYIVKCKTSDGLIHELHQGELYTSGMHRALYLDGTYNARDLGGWPALNGKIVRYNKLFRSAELYWEEGPFEISERGINEIVNNIGIDVEIDFGDIDSSPLINDVDFYRGDDFQIIAYQAGLDPTSDTYTGVMYKNCFYLLLDKLRNGEKVLFHCKGGCDRTGTFAFLLNGLLGVSESDLSKDYEMSSLHSTKYKRTRNNDPFSGMVNYIKTNFNGETINEKIENLWLGLGVQVADIAEFRKLMLE